MRVTCYSLFADSLKELWLSCLLASERKLKSLKQVYLLLYMYLYVCVCAVSMYMFVFVLVCSCVYKQCTLSDLKC